MSEIANVIQYLGEVVYYTFDQTLDGIATILIIASAILPWRWHEISDSIYSNNSRHWKVLCIISLLITISDFIAVPCLLLSIVSPMRWYDVAKIMGKYTESSNRDINSYFNHRLEAVLTFMIVLVDILTTPFILLTLVSPYGRQIGLLVYIFKHHSILDNKHQTFTLNTIYFWSGKNSVLDLLSLCLLPLIILVPTTWFSLCRIFLLIWRDGPKLTHASWENISEFYTSIRALVVMHGQLALLDIVAVVPFIFAFISPFTYHKLMNLLWSPTTLDSENKLGRDEAPPLESKNPNFELRIKIIEMGIGAITDAILFPVKFILWVVHRLYEYLVLIPIEFVYYLSHSAFDCVILSPMILILWLTRYRFHCILHLMTRERQWTATEVITVTKQFSCLIVDIFLFSVPLFFVFLTQIRWSSIKLALSFDETLKTRNIELYWLLIKQIFYFLVDILTLPLLLFLMLTSYRYGLLIPVFSHSECFNHGLKINGLVLYNALIVLYDVIFVVPFLSITTLLIGFPRLYCLYGLYEHHSQEYYKRYQRLEEKSQQSKISVENNSSSNAISEIKNAITFSDIVDQLHSDDFSIRAEFWLTLFHTISDFPFLIMGIVVVASLWRCGELVNELKQIFKTDNFQELSSKDKYQRFEDCLLSSQDAVRRHFIGLLLDILVAIVLFMFMSLVLASVYRTPGLIFDFLALAFESSAIAGLPFFDTKSIEITWKNATDPIICLSVKPLESVENPTEQEQQDQDHRISCIHDAEYFQVTLLGDKVWKELNDNFGGLTTSILVSLLPLKLRLSKGEIGIIRPGSVVDQGSSTNTQTSSPNVLSREVSVNQDNLEVNTSSHPITTEVNDKKTVLGEIVSDKLWIKFPSKFFSRSFLLSKLRSLAPTTPLVFQISGLIVSSSQKEGREVANKSTMYPIAYFSFTAGQLLYALSSQGEIILVEHEPYSLENYRLLNQTIIDDYGKSKKFDCVLIIIMRHFLSLTMDIVNAILFIWGVIQSIINMSLSTGRYFASTSAGIMKSIALGFALVLGWIGNCIECIIGYIVELVMIFAHFVLFILLLLSPLRFIQCFNRLFSNDEQIFTILNQDMWRNICETEYHLQRLRDILVPILNHYAKIQYFKTTNNQGFAWTNCPEVLAMEKRKRFEINYHLHSYKALVAVANYQINRIQTLSIPDNDVVSGKSIDAKMLKEYFHDHDRMFHWLFAHHGIWSLKDSQTNGNNMQSSADEEERHQKCILCAMVLVEEHDRVVDDLLRQKRLLKRSFQFKSSEERVDENGNIKKAPTLLSQLYTKCKIRSAYKAIIVRMAGRVIKDWLGLLCLILMLVSIVEFVPFLHSLYWKERKVSVKSILKFHILRLWHTLFQLARLIMGLALLMVTVVGLPNFIDDMRTSVLHTDTTIEDIADCAWYELRNFWVFLWELFAFVTAFKTYRILMKCLLYCLLLPGAVIADAFGTIFSTNKESLPFRFTLGSVIFFALFATGILFSNATTFHKNASLMNNSLLALLSIIMVVQLVVGVLSFYHPANKQKYSTTNTNSSNGWKSRAMMLRLQWSHILSIVASIIECFTISSVILFFFWQSPDMTMKEVACNFQDLNVSSQLDTTDYLSRLLFWNVVNKREDIPTMNREVSLACFASIIWGILISIPLVQGGEKDDYRHHKIIEILHHPTYQTLIYIFGQIFGVWIIATLLRPNSCVDLYNSVNAPTADLTSCFYNSTAPSTVMSTNLSYQCGSRPPGYNLGHAALPLLVYYLITSAIVHPRFYEPPHNNESSSKTASSRREPNNDSKKSSQFIKRTEHIFDIVEEVKVHPSYQLYMRVIQTLICTVCFTLVGATSSTSILIPIFIVILLTVLAPYWSYWVAANKGDNLEDHMTHLCSVPSLVIIRSVAYLAIAWTTFVCILRASIRANDTETLNRFENNLTIFATESSIYIGWGLLAIGASLYIYWVESLRHNQWDELLATSGINSALDSLKSLYKMISTEFYMHNQRSRQRTNTTTSSTSIASFIFPTNNGNEEEMKWKSMLLQATGDSLPGIIRLILELENLVPIDRLSLEFLSIRERWIAALKSLLIADTNIFDTQTVYDTNTLVNAPEIREFKINQVTNNIRANDHIWLDYIYRARISTTAIDQDDNRDSNSDGDEDGEDDENFLSCIQLGIENQIQDPRFSVKRMARILSAAASNKSADLNENNNPMARIQFRLQALRDLIMMLQFGCYDAFTNIYVSKEALVTILSYRRIPRELSWLIFSYMIDIRHVRNLLIYGMNYHQSVEFMNRVRKIQALSDAYSSRNADHKNEEDKEALQKEHRLEEKAYEEVLRKASNRLPLPRNSSESAEKFVQQNMSGAIDNLRRTVPSVLQKSVSALSGQSAQIVYR